VPAPAPESAPTPPRATASELEFDPELLALPGPPRRERRLGLVVLVLAAMAALAMAVALRHDAAFALAPSEPIDLGDLRTASAATLGAAENRSVRAEAFLGAAGAIRYERLLLRDTFRALPVAGRRDVWVELRVPSGPESGRWEPPTSISGHLVRFEDAGPRHRALASAIERVNREALPADAWLLIDGEGPEHARWALVLAVTFLAFAAWHGATIARMLRRTR
jgi:hypothetical protein